MVKTISSFSIQTLGSKFIVTGVKKIEKKVKKIKGSEYLDSLDAYTVPQKRAVKLFYLLADLHTADDSSSSSSSSSGSSSDEEATASKSKKSSSSSKEDKPKRARPATVAPPNYNVGEEGTFVNGEESIDFRIAEVKKKGTALVVEKIGTDDAEVVVMTLTWRSNRTWLPEGENIRKWKNAKCFFKSDIVPEKVEQAEAQEEEVVKEQE